MKTTLFSVLFFDILNLYSLVQSLSYKFLFMTTERGSLLPGSCRCTCLRLSYIWVVIYKNLKLGDWTYDIDRVFYSFALVCKSRLLRSTIELARTRQQYVACVAFKGCNHLQIFLKYTWPFFSPHKLLELNLGKILILYDFLVKLFP